MARSLHVGKGDQKVVPGHARLCARASVAEGREREKEKGLARLVVDMAPDIFLSLSSLCALCDTSGAADASTSFGPAVFVGRSAAIIDSGPEFVSRSDLIHPNGVTTHTPAIHT